MDSKYPYSILFIEDEDDIRKNYTVYLENYFKYVYEAKDGLEGYRVYKERRPDILIIDINIPHMKGIELLRKIRENDYQTKAIMLTAHTDLEYLLQTNSLKLIKYLLKPVKRAELKETLLLAIDEIQKYRIETLQTIELGNNYRWDCALSQLSFFHEIVELTNKEQRLLELLFSKRNKVFTYEEIFHYVWEYYSNENMNYMNALRSLMKNLRKKIPRELIGNYFGIGYKINQDYMK